MHINIGECYFDNADHNLSDIDASTLNKIQECFVYTISSVASN